MTLTERIEAHAARILGAPVRITQAQAAAMRVLTFEHQPVEEAFTLMTAGLAESHGQELLLCGWSSLLTDDVYNTMFAIAQLVYAEQMNIAAGMFLELPQPIAPSTPIHHLMLWPPVYHDEALQQLAEEVDVLWLVPLLPQEAAWLERRGAAAFDALMSEHDPDLLDWTRASVV